MIKFILGFLIGIITEFAVLMIVAYKVKKQREKELIHRERLNNEAKEHMSDFLHLANWDSVQNLTKEERDKYFKELYKAHSNNMTDLQNELRGYNNE